MTTVLIELLNWLHSLATVVFIGHYVLLALVYLPALQQQPQQAAGAVISAVSKQSRSWLYAALLVFFLTGGYLTLVDPNYRGLGNFTNPWAIGMLIKHLIVVVMIGLGWWFNGVLRVGPIASSNTGGAAAIARFRSHVNLMAALGVVVLLLTAFSQAQ